MDSTTYLLVTVLHHGTLLRCALTVPEGALESAVLDYPMEPEHREQIHAMLPLNVRSCGPVVEVDEIFAIA